MLRTRKYEYTDSCLTILKCGMQYPQVCSPLRNMYDPPASTNYNKSRTKAMHKLHETVAFDAIKHCPVQSVNVHQHYYLGSWMCNSSGGSSGRNRSRCRNVGFAGDRVKQVLYHQGF